MRGKTPAVQSRVSSGMLYEPVFLGRRVRLAPPDLKAVAEGVAKWLAKGLAKGLAKKLA